jgi:flotillin
MIEKYLIIFVVLTIVVLLLIAIVKRFKRCPSDKVLVVYGKLSGGKTSKCITGGITFIYPIIQDYEYLDLNVFKIDIKDIFYNKDNSPIIFEIELSFGINSEPKYVGNAAEILIGLSQKEINMMVNDIIYVQIRVVFNLIDKDEIQSGKEKIISLITQKIEKEVQKIGLKLVRLYVKKLH